MNVSAVRTNEDRSPFSTVVKTTIAGGAIGYASKYFIPLQKSEKNGINYRAVINSSRKDVNRQKVAEFRALGNKTEAQDAFVKMIDYRNADVKEPVTSALKAFENDLKETFKTGFDKDVFKQKIETFGENVRRSYSEAMTARTSNTGTTLSKSLETLGDELAKLFKDGIDEKKLNSKLSAFNEEYLRNISNNKDVFTTENIKSTVASLGGENSSAGKEFKRIIREVNEAAGSTSRKLVEACHSVLKGKRLAAPLIAAGAIAGFAGGLIHNVLKTNSETEV